jgi:hypothetical protein
MWVIVLRAARHWDGDSSLSNAPFAPTGHHPIVYMPSTPMGLRGCDYLIPCFSRDLNVIGKQAKAIKESPVVHAPCQNFDLFQPAVLANQSTELSISANLRQVRYQRGGETATWYRIKWARTTIHSCSGATCLIARTNRSPVLWYGTTPRTRESKLQYMKWGTVQTKQLIIKKLNIYK